MPHAAGPRRDSPLDARNPRRFSPVFPVVAASAAALVLLGGCSHSPSRRLATPPGPVDVAPNPSVVVVTASGGKPGEYSTGLVVQRGVVLTTGHGVHGRTRVSVRSTDGTRVPSRGLLAESREHDLAALDVGEAVTAPALETADRRPRAGEWVRVVWASGVRTQRTDLAVVARGEQVVAPWGVVFEIHAPLALGCSGAPVLNDGDEVVGVIVAGNPDRGFFYAVPARFVEEVVGGIAGGSARVPAATPTPDAADAERR